MHGIELRRYSHEISLILKYIDIKSDINFHVYFNKKIRDYAVPCYLLCFHSVSVIGKLEAAHIYKCFVRKIMQSSFNYLYWTMHFILHVLLCHWCIVNFKSDKISCTIMLEG